LGRIFAVAAVAALAVALRAPERPWGEGLAPERPRGEGLGKKPLRRRGRPGRLFLSLYRF